MTPARMSESERNQLIDDLLDGSIAEADLLRIEAEMCVDSEVRQQYYCRLKLNLLLEREAVGEDARQSVVPDTDGNASTDNDNRIDGKQMGDNLPNRIPLGGNSRGALVAGLLIGLAASLVFILAVYPWDIGDADASPTMTAGPGSRMTGSRTTTVANTEPSATGFAILKGQKKADWGASAMAVGDLLPEGQLHLKSGLAQVEFFSGVQMVIEGDAKFQIDSAMQVTILRGAARARVPEPARGFKVKTSSGDIVDLGTEFSLSVDEDGADVSVLDGEVELWTSEQNGLSLLGGKTLRMERSGKVVDAGPAQLDLVGPADFYSVLKAQQFEKIAGWESKTPALASDSRLLAFYRFSGDGDASGNVRNLASAAGELASNGAIVASETTADRWGRSNQALDFSRLGSRVRVTVPGEHRGLTMLCWVKINSLDRWYNSLFLTDGHDDREPHWQIMDDGRIFFSVKVPSVDVKSAPEKQHVFYSPSIWDASLSGRWIMLGVTYDVDAKTVTHYVDGKPISSESIPDAAFVPAIRIGEASICNWSGPTYRSDAKFVLRNLNGSMDEFSIYSGGLTAGEILNLYRVGNPDDL